MHIDTDVKDKFPTIIMGAAEIKDLKVKPSSKAFLKRYKDHQKTVGGLMHGNFKDGNIVPPFSFYRAFFHKLHIDPTKIRPASEALVRKLINGREILAINNVVDAYNMASIMSSLTLGAYDASKIKGSLNVRLAEPLEIFEGLGDKNIELKGGEVVLADDEKIVSIYPYRDSKHSRVTNSTTDVVLIVYGVPGVKRAAVESALNTAIDLITENAGGHCVGGLVID